MSIKYYHLAKDETPPEELCAIRDVGGEPSEYMFYVPEAENEKLRELAKYAILCSEGDARCLDCPYHDKTAEPHIICMMRKAARELGVEVAL